jgi:hypothetical protein
MSTQEYPQLPGGGPGGPPPMGPTYSHYPAYYGPPPMHPATVPPLPPPPRSTGFWVGISGAVALGIVAMLLVGFFIGRGTRLSNESVQAKITQQSQADQIAEQQALDKQSASLQEQKARAVVAARHNAREEGRSEGFKSGQESGYQNGHAAGYTEGNATGLAQGETHGFSEGLNQGACLANTIYCSGG